MEIPGYRLEDRLGRGGMGEVWGATHLATDTPVAIKVLTGASAAAPAVSDFLRHEVRAVAALDHPNVVGVLDCGVAPSRLPWLVLERVDGPSLAEVGPMSWDGIRAVLRSLLDALAHAHARGVLHRDVKPGNVLVGRGGVVKLVDFGLARLAGGAEAQPGGTPSFAAPEQLLGALGQQGPWTDLYALGCLAWRLCTGAAPFRARGFVDALHVQLRAELPRFEPRMPVPAGLEAWLRSLLAREPAGRIRRAADAAWGLVRLGEPVGRAEAPSEREPLDPEAPTLAFLPRSCPGGSPPPGRADRPPTPADWRGPRRALRMLRGAGLGLVGLRAVPLVGRAARQDRLWSLLCEVEATGRPRAVVLHGPPGVGKTALAGWLGRRAHEVGAAEHLVARHDPALGEASGLLPALARHLGCAGAEPEERRLVLERWVEGLPGGAELAPALADLLEGRAPSGAERLGVLGAALRALATERPLVVQLDDADADPEAVPLVEATLEAGRDPILFLLTAADDRPFPASFDRVEVPPLDPEGRRELVRELLGLQGELAVEVEERSGGHPLFAVQLVGDWVARGVLVPGAHGFRLADGALAHVPGSLRELGAEAVGRALDPADEACVLVAAVLGLEVEAGEWRAACAALGVEASERALDRLADARLARRTRRPEGLALAHGLVRDALLERVERSGRAREVHRACAGVVADPTRRGLHLVAAGEDEAALAPLLESIDRSTGDDDYRRAIRPLEVREEALSRLGVAASDPRWGEGRLHRVRVLRLRGDWPGAEAAARALVEEADRHGWAVATRARLEHAMALRALGRGEEALEILEHARPGAEAEPFLRGMWLLRRGLVLVDARRLEEARAACAAARAIFETLDRPSMAGHAHLAASMAESRDGDLDRAEAHLLAAKDAYTASGSRAGVANTWNNLGELLRHRGDPAGAARAYREALRRYEAIGSGHAVLPRANLGFLELEAGRPTEALAVLAEAALDLDRQGRLPLLAVVEAGRMLACAILGDGPRYDALATRVLDLVGRTRVADPADVARYAARAARCWDADPARAVAALRIERRTERIG